MAGHDHPILAGVFVLGVMGLLAYGAYGGLTRPMEPADHHGAAARLEPQAHDPHDPHEDHEGHDHADRLEHSAHAGEAELPVQAQNAKPLDPVSAEIMEAVMMGEGGNIEGAAKKLREISERHPDNTDALFNLGIALTGLERFDEADRVFQQVLEKEPEDYEAVAERATILLAQGKVEQALALAENIPPGEGRLGLRLEYHERWATLKGDRVAALKKKHGAR